MKKSITIYDIAKTAEVSPATVSRMMNQPNIVTEKTRARILAAFDHHGITPEDLMSKKKQTGNSSKRGSQKSLNILVCIPNWDNPFYDDILTSIQEYLFRNQHHMIATTDIPNRNTMASFINYCHSLQVSGIILMYPLSEDLMRQLSTAFPIVQCSEYNPFYQHVPYVSIDDYTITKAAIAHLINAGCKNIAFFSSSYEYRYVQDRYRAYKTMLSGNGMSIRPEYVVQVSDFSYNRILNTAQHFFQLPEPPDAIFATSDKHAHAVIKAGQSMGFRIPEDVKVFGFDDTMYSFLSTPTISTVHQPRKELGEESAKLLLRIIENPYANAAPILLPTKLLIQEST